MKDLIKEDLDFVPDILLIDGMNLTKRYHHALSVLSDDHGVPMGAPYGIFKYILEWRKKVRRIKIYVLWEGKMSYRKVMYPEYKNRNRKQGNDELFNESIKVLKEGLRLLGVTQVTGSTVEADDLAGYFVSQFCTKNILLSSNDKDWFQYLTTDKIRIQSDLKTIKSKEGVEKELGFPPWRIVIYKSLTGDSSDNVRG
jgi:DNA polymerase-1